MYLSFLGSYFWFLRLKLEKVPTISGAFLFLSPQGRGLNILAAPAAPAAQISAATNCSYLESPRLLSGSHLKMVN
jgi:hypothetical protein